jgi:heat shock protein HtpX
MFGGYGNRDDRNSGGGLIGILVMAIVAPLAAMLIQMAISRSREYAADAVGARTCGRPQSLANALRKLHTGTQRRPMQANPATAHMFIMNPLSGQSFASLFSTHPPVEERIARLEQLTYAR